MWFVRCSFGVCLGPHAERYTSFSLPTPHTARPSHRYCWIFGEQKSQAREYVQHSAIGSSVQIGCPRSSAGKLNRRRKMDLGFVINNTKCADLRAELVIQYHTMLPSSAGLKWSDLTKGMDLLTRSLLSRGTEVICARCWGALHNSHCRRSYLFYGRLLFIGTRYFDLFLGMHGIKNYGKHEEHVF